MADDADSSPGHNKAHVCYQVPRKPSIAQDSVSRFRDNVRFGANASSGYPLVFLPAGLFVMTRMPVFSISHDGGPWPYMDELRSDYQQTESALRQVAKRLPTQPTSILLLTAHWEASVFSVATSATPAMEYDYGGFSEHTYTVQYPAPGNQLLAGRIQVILANAGFSARLDSSKGFDHGVFVPLGMMFPEAAVPVIVLSVKGGFDPAEHLALGQGGHDAEDLTRYLDANLVEMDANLRAQRLLHWQRAPSARASQSSRGASDAASSGRWCCGCCG